MKNIYLIPTDKPSRLWINTITGELVLDEEPNTLHSQNIYITSDEEITEMDWFYDLDTKYIKIKQSLNNSHLGFNGKKIVLTTDQDLIKDGVQVIDDEFLQWYVKNPSCDEVKVEITEISCIIPNFGDVDKYRIAIPIENQNQHFIDMMKAKEKLGLYEEPETDYSFFIKQKEEEFRNFLKKREATPEEVAEYLGFVKGVKWQQERSYSEEEVFNLLMELSSRDKNSSSGTPHSIAKWFEQFKK